MITVIYLWINAIAYVSFAAWCTLFPKQTASGIGFSFISPSAKSEYITVYGGLEAGMAVFFVLGAIRPELRSAALVFCVCMYTGLVVFRMGTILMISDLSKLIYILFALEVLLGAGAWALWLTRR